MMIVLFIDNRIVVYDEFRRGLLCTFAFSKTRVRMKKVLKRLVFSGVYNMADLVYWLTHEHAPNTFIGQADLNLSRLGTGCPAPVGC